MSDVDITWTNQDLIDWSEVKEDQGRKNLEEIVRRLQIKKVQAIPQASTYQGSTRIPNSRVPQRQEPDIEIVLDSPTRVSDIRELVKAHVKNHQDFKIFNKIHRIPEDPPQVQSEQRKEKISMSRNKSEPKEEITLLIKSLSDQMSQLVT
ncbi:hypothetical protein BY996DRAFT_6573995 [Phakopsora pachyrhizi]|nr:hypothetical protein BY996DRAFT_6573995 [Phakopsora pachyrhizi]